MGRRPSELHHGLITVFGTADRFGRVLLREDYETLAKASRAEVRQIVNRFSSFREIFEIPSAVAAPDAGQTLTQIAQQVVHSSPRIAVQELIGTKALPQGFTGMIVTPSAFRAAGPLFAAVQDQNRSELRIAVVAEGNLEQQSVYRQTVEEWNKSLKLSGEARLRVYDNFQQAWFALIRKVSSPLVAVVFDEAEAALLRRSIPDVIIRDRDWVEGLSQNRTDFANLLSQFSAEFARAFDSAA